MGQPSRFPSVHPETAMRRDEFLRATAALALAGGLPFAARASGPTLHMMLPANPGGSRDTSERALGKTLIESKTADTVQNNNKSGAAGALGLAQFAQSSRGD